MLSFVSLHYVFISLILTNYFLIIYSITYSDTHDYDAYGTLIASTDYFVVLAQNDGQRFTVSMAPFGGLYTCSYLYTLSNSFIINVATSRRQNASQLSFVYLRTNSIDGYNQILGIFKFSRENNNNSLNSTCKRMLDINEGTHDVKTWYRKPSEMSTLQVDLDGKYAYGFLSEDIFIYNIDNSSVQDLNWTNVFPSISLEPHALDVGKTNDGVSMAIIAGYYQFDIEKTLPGVYLVRLDPPYNMTLVSNYTLFSDNQKFVRGRDASTYKFGYVMSVSIHDSTKKVLVGVPQLSATYIFSFNSTNLTFIKKLDHAARSTAWLDDDGIQAGLLLSDTSTLPWANSRVYMVNVSSANVLHAYPNNQQTLEPWASSPPTFLRLTKTYDYQYVILSTDGIVILVPTAEAGYYATTDDINSEQKESQACPIGTYKSTRGTTPCTICPTMTKSSSTNVSSNSSNNINTNYPTTICTACLSNSFCPLGSIKDINNSTFEWISQAYAYPSSSASASYDDILMQNTFSLQSTPRRCLFISPFFWALITLVLAFIILVIMGFLYYSPTGKKHYHRLEWFFLHSDLVSNGEFWFGGAISFAIIVLIIYDFWFGTVFIVKYPIETSTDANFACDPSLRNTQFTSALQLLAVIKTDEEKPIFKMLDEQEFIMNISFIQTGFTCTDIHAQQNVGTYTVSLEFVNCTENFDTSMVTAIYRMPQHQMTIQLNLTGFYYIGGIYICLSSPNSTDNDSRYMVKEMKYCEVFSTSDQTIGQTTEIAFTLTKTINRTESLDYSGLTNYSGIWIPTSTNGSLNDYLVYSQSGAFLRYLSTQHTVIITFSETSFYVNNQQQPIVRMGEILYHNILFTTTVIGIFALAFLLFKLMFMPIAKWIIKRKFFLLQNHKSKDEKMVDNENTL